MFRTLPYPLARSRSAALALRPPILQWTTTSRAGSISLNRLGNSPSGISRLRDIADLVLEDLAHVDQLKIVTAVEPRLDFDRIDVARCHFRNLRLLGYSAELMIINQFGDSRMGAAHRAIRVFPQFQFAEAHGEGVIKQQTALEGFALPEDQFDYLRGLDQADDARQDA